MEQSEVKVYRFAGDRSHCRLDEQIAHPGDGQAETHSQSGHDDRAQPHAPRGFVRCMRRFDCSAEKRPVQQDHRHGNHEDIGGHSRSGDKQRQELLVHCSLIDQFFAHKSEKRREARHRQGRQHCRSCGDGHFFRQAAQLVQFSGAALMVDRADHQKQGAFI